jgi:hypothetical protein
MEILAKDEKIYGRNEKLHRIFGSIFLGWQSF